MGSVQSTTTTSSGAPRSALAQSLDPHGLFLEPSSAFGNADPSVSADQYPAHCRRRSSSLPLSLPASTSPGSSLDSLDPSLDAVLDIGKTEVREEEEEEEKGDVLSGQDLIDGGMARIVPSFIAGMINERPRKKRAEDAFRRRVSGNVGSRIGA